MRSRIDVSTSCLVVVLDRYDNISGFLPFFDISGGVDDLFQGVTSIYNRFVFPRLDKLFKKNDVFFTDLRERKLDLLAADDRGRRRQKDILR
jgi:hypothetical protein